MQEGMDTVMSGESIDAHCAFSICRVFWYGKLYGEFKNDQNERWYYATGTKIEKEAFGKMPENARMDRNKVYDVTKKKRKKS